MGRPLTYELPSEIPMVLLHHLFVIFLSTHLLLCHLPSRHVFPLPSSSCWWWPFGCTHTRCIFLSCPVSVFSNSIRPSRSNSDPQEPVLPTPGPRASFFGDWPEVRVWGTASTTLNNYWWKSVVTVPLPPIEKLCLYIFFNHHTELSAGLEAELSTLVICWEAHFPPSLHWLPLQITYHCFGSHTENKQPSFLSFLKASFCDMATRHLHQHSFNLLQVHEVYS